MMKEIVKSKEKVTSFVGRISKMGERKIVYIPKEIEHLGLPKSKYVKVRLEEVISE